MTIASAYCFRVFSNYVWKGLYYLFLNGLGRLFHKEGPMYNRVFWPMLVLQKGSWSLAKLFLVSILQYGWNSKISFRYKGSLLLTNLNVIAFMHWWTLLLVGNQVIDLNSIRVMMHFLQSKANCMHLFSIICILFCCCCCCFFSKTWVPCWTCTVKMWLNKCIGKHSAKLWS